jgi:hypothetical protein
MIYQSKKTVGNAIKDPKRFYKDTDSVLADRRLSQADKDKALHSWEQDQLAMLRSEGENRYPRSHALSPQEILEKAGNAGRILENCRNR